MLPRAIAVLLVVVLLWCSFATHEQHLAGSRAAGQVELAPAGAAGGASSGSVDDHHLDDQPGQSVVETMTDLPVGLPVTTPALAHRGRGIAPSPAPAVALATRTPEAPQRPPRA